MREFNLTRRQKIFLEESGLNPKNWRRINESSMKLIIRHKISGKIKVVRKDESGQVKNNWN